jgi:hypothetical protein
VTRQELHAAGKVIGLVGGGVEDRVGSHNPYRGHNDKSVCHECRVPVEVPKNTGCGRQWHQNSRHYSLRPTSNAKCWNNLSRKNPVMNKP